MAATFYGSAHMGVVPFTGLANPVETFSSDGPRKIFYNPDGTADHSRQLPVCHQRRHHAAEA